MKGPNLYYESVWKLYSHWKHTEKSWIWGSGRRGEEVLASLWWCLRFNRRTTAAVMDVETHQIVRAGMTFPPRSGRGQTWTNPQKVEDWGLRFCHYLPNSHVLISSDNQWWKDPACCPKLENRQQFYLTKNFLRSLSLLDQIQQSTKGSDLFFIIYSMMAFPTQPLPEECKKTFISLGN